MGTSSGIELSLTMARADLYLPPDYVRDLVLFFARIRPLVYRARERGQGHQLVVLLCLVNGKKCLYKRM